MKVRLGYVALPLTINVTSSSLLTYTHFIKLKDEEGLLKLDKTIKSNLNDVKKILDYNYKNNIHFFRLTSKLIPLATHKEVLFDYHKPYKKEYQELKKIIEDTKIRLDMHPDQFTVLNSDREEVVSNSIEILKYHDQILKELGIKNGKLILHVGSSSGGKTNAIKRFKENFYLLPLSVRKRIILENDDKIFDIQDVLDLCLALNIPMVLDYHHFLCNNKEELIEDYLKKIFATWKETNLPPKIHFSSPKNKTKKDFRSHSEYINPIDFISFLEKLKIINQDVDIMLEAKGKDRALFDLVRCLKYLTTYEFLDETTFVI